MEEMKENNTVTHQKKQFCNFEITLILKINFMFSSILPYFLSTVILLLLLSSPDR